MKDRIPNYDIFEKYSEYWNLLTDYGETAVPDYIESWIRNSKGEVIKERKHPVIVLTEGERWMVNYSDTI